MDTTSFKGIIGDSNQLQPIHKLTSVTTLDISIISSMQKYTPYLISTSITRLTIKCEQGLLQVDWLLEIFSSLEIAFITHSECDVKRAEINPSQIDGPAVYPKLRALHISQCSFHPNVLRYLKIATPNITRMTLSTVNVFSKSTREAYYIDLSDCNLKEFNIHWPSSVRISTNRKFYRRFLIQTNAKEPIHASLGDNIILRRVSGILERVENTIGSDPI